MPPEIILKFEIRRSHRYLQRLGFCRPGNYAAIVITENNNRFSPQVWSENSLTTGVKRINVNQGEHQKPPLGLKT